MKRLPFFSSVFLCALALSAGATRAHAAESLCDSSFQNCRTQLLSLIDNENVGIDVAFWFMEDQRYVNHLIARWNAGVPVRLIVDPRANPTYPLNSTSLAAFGSAGIPMVKKTGGGIMHWKTMLFAGQNTVEFGSANYSDNAFVPVAPFTNYVGETIYYSDDPAVVNSFKTKFDNLWTDTSNYSTYANITSRVRVYPTFTITSDLNFPPGQSYASRLIGLEKTETQKIDVIMYRITQQAHSDALIAAKQRGVPVRYVGETREYRLVERLWVAFNMDRMYAAGIPMRVRKAEGENHEKLVLLYGQGRTIFGSSNWTSASDNSQQEHNYFTSKNWIFTWFVNQFERKWNSDTETTPFVPLPPDEPVYQSIADGAAGVPTTGQKLVWYGGPWAHYYDVYFGTDPLARTLFAASLRLGPSQTTTQTQSFALPTLQPGTTYYWKIVSKTAANVANEGPIWSFTTTGTAQPPPGGATTIVLWTGNVPSGNIAGNWTRIADATAAGSAALQNTDHGASKIAPALAIPANFFETTFTAPGGVAYHLWVRLRAQADSLSNDSVHIQFSDSLTSAGAATMRIGTTSSAEVVLQNGSTGPPDHGWGWSDNGWGALGAHIVFATTGSHVIRVQQREDGAILDQIVLSPDTYLTTPPGGRQDDATILPATETTSAGGGGTSTLGAGDVLLHPGDATAIVGDWARTPDATAATGASLLNPDRNAAKISAPLATPANYFEMTFAAAGSTPYRLWIRGKATADSWSNDSVYMQFNDSIDSNGVAAFRIGTADATTFNLEECFGCGLAGWGWEDNGWGVNVAGPLIRFAAGGTHTIRIQVREDGLAIDQILLSPEKYLSQSPGALKNDATMLQ